MARQKAKNETTDTEAWETEVPEETAEVNETEVAEITAKST